LTNTGALSAGAWASGGSRLDGTARRPADAATASRTCAKAARTVASWALRAGTFAGGSATMLAFGAATPWPTGDGVSASSSTHAQAAAALAAAAAARLALTDRRSAAANRPGFSTRCSVITASPPDTAVALSLAGSPAGSPRSCGMSSRTGQCHRYHEYDTRPIARIAGRHSTRPTPRPPVTPPAPITSAVPSTGSSAAVPG
ncbi:Mycobacterium terramassiliense ORFan, partial [Mycobacterium terramassiliense]